MSQNNFADMFKMFSENSPFSKMAAGFDMNQVTAMGKKNFEALNAVNQVVAENMQNLAKRQAQIVQEGAKEMMNFVKEVSSEQNPEAGMKKCACFSKHSLECAVSNTRELMDVAVKSGMEVYDLLFKKMSEGLSEAAPAMATMGGKKKTA